MKAVTSTIIKAIVMYRNTCGQGFTTNRGLLLHLNGCRRKQEQQNQQLEANDDQENSHRL